MFTPTQDHLDTVEGRSSTNTIEEISNPRGLLRQKENDGKKGTLGLKDVPTAVGRSRM
jgi:hypothetical protein